MSFKLSYRKFGPVVQEKSFKDISYLELLQPPCSVDWNNLCEFGRRHHEEQSCEKVQEEMPPDDISYLELWQPFCLAEPNQLSNFGKGIMRNNSVKLF